jgi:chromosome segregation ATPase
MENQKPNPNETILIPMLHKRVNDLTTATIMLEAKLAWAEEEKKELVSEIGGKNQQILDLEHSQAANQQAIEDQLETARQKVRAQWQAEKTELLLGFEKEKQQIASSFDQKLEFITNDVRRAAQMDIGFANARVDEVSRENKQLKARIAELEGTILPPTPDSSNKGSPKKRSKKESTVMGGDTY